MNHNLTIIIPTHERHQLLRRAINYYECFNYKIIIVDSSKKNLQYNFRHNFSYFHFPNEKFCLKIYKIIYAIKTDFVSICPDDDFLISEFLEKTILKMSSNKNISSLRGTSVKFKYQDQKLYFNNFRPIQRKYNKNNFGLIYSKFPNLLYGVMRRKVLEQSLIISKDFNFITLLEWLLPMIAIRLGDVEIIKDINILRDNERYSDYFEIDKTPYFKQKTIDLKNDNKNKKNEFIIIKWHTFFNSIEGKSFIKNILSFDKTNNLSLQNIKISINNFIFKKNEPTYFDKFTLVFKLFLKKIISKYFNNFQKKNIKKRFVEKKINVVLDLILQNIEIKK